MPLRWRENLSGASSFSCYNCYTWVGAPWSSPIPQGFADNVLSEDTCLPLATYRTFPWCNLRVECFELCPVHSLSPISLRKLFWAEAKVLLLCFKSIRVNLFKNGLYKCSIQFCFLINGCNNTLVVSDSLLAYLSSCLTALHKSNCTHNTAPVVRITYGGGGS